MDKKKKILIIHNYYQIPGGEDVVVANEKEMLEKHGHEVVLYTRSNSEIKEMSIIQKILLPFASIFNIKAYADVKKIIIEEKIDVVHVHNTLSLISPAVYYAACICGVPVVQTIHNFRLLCPSATFYRNGNICEDCLKYGLKSSVKHGCYRKSRLQTLVCVIGMKLHRMTKIYGKINYICLTDFNKEKLLQLKMINSQNVFVKPNFMNKATEFVPQEKRRDQFVFAGRLDELKGVDILLKAWKEISKIRSSSKLLICGIGPMEAWCKEFVETNNLDVEMKGFVPNTEVREIIANSKALILPTRWYEGFPMSIVEAFSVGTPVICTDIGNAGSIVEEGKCGYKFQNESVTELVKIVENFEGLSKSTFDIFESRYTEEINYKTLNSIYNKMKRKI